MKVASVTDELQVDFSEQNQNIVGISTCSLTDKDERRTNRVLAITPFSVFK